MSTRRELKLTQAQATALDALLEKTGESFAAFVRRCAEQEGIKYGIRFPQDMPPRPSIEEARAIRSAKAARKRKQDQ